MKRLDISPIVDYPQYGGMLSQYRLKSTRRNRSPKKYRLGTAARSQPCFMLATQTNIAALIIAIADSVYFVLIQASIWSAEMRDSLGCS